METIIYLKIKKGTDCKENPFLHLRLYRDICFPEEGRQILLVKIPPESARGQKEQIKELCSYLVPFYGYSTDILTVFDEEFRDLIVRSGFRKQWEENWPYRSYCDYHQKEYCEFLLKKGMKRVCRNRLRIYVIGYREFVPQILKDYLNRMEMLTFFVRDRAPEHLETYLDTLCFEEGIAAVLREYPETEFSGLRPDCGTGAVVIDLSGEEKVIPSDHTKDAVWIDMDSCTAKKKKIQARIPETMYFSMKDSWRSLDTGNKNGYNTIVN